MSLCSQTIRAISRSRGPRPSTLLPFLYQTATIQQWNPATRPHPRRNVYSRSKPADEIPFADADGNLPPSVDEAQAPRKTTITDTERAAFEKLYKTFKAREHGEKEKGEHEELDQIADEYYEDDEEPKHTPLDKVFEELLYGKPQSEESLYSKPQLKPERLSPYKKKHLAAKAETERISNIRLGERERIDALLQKAQTDCELWQILDREVFDQLRKLNLDEPNPAKKTKRSKPPPNDPKARIKRAPPPPKSLSSTAEAQALFTNYPHHLITALEVFRRYFPRSPLPHSVLPTIKALGRSSYALGATTQLYKRLIRAAWLQHSSYSLVDTLLTDMDTNVVDFSVSILQFLDRMIEEYDTARTGELGKELQMVYGMESWREGIEKIKSWREVVAGRLGVPQPEAANVGRPVREGTVEWRKRDDRRGVREGTAEWRKRDDRRGAREGRDRGRGWETIRRARGGEDVPIIERQGARTQSGTVEDTAEEDSLHRDVEGPTQPVRPAEAQDEEGDDRPAKVML